MRTGRVNSDDLLFYLVLFVVVLNLVLPGETWFQTRALSQLLAFAGLGALLVARSRLELPDHPPTGRIAAIFAVFLLCFLPSMLFSSCPGRSLETLALWLAYLSLFVLVRHLRPAPRLVERAITLICLTMVLLLLYALYQYITGFGGLALEVAADTTLTEGQRAEMLSRLASRRVFSTFPLPTTFAELVVITLPLLLHRARAARHNRSRRGMAGWGAALLLAAVVLPLTGSFGILPVLAVLGFIALLAGAPGWSTRRRVAVAGAALICVALAFVVVLQVRGFTPWAADQAHNPVSQRLFNWRSAVSIWHDHQLAGAGPGNFAVAYAGHRLPGANETVVAHNTYLHTAAEGGILPVTALVLLALLLGGGAVRRLLAGPAPGGDEEATRALSYASLALLLYACFEITVEFPGIGYPGIFLIALTSLRLFPPGTAAPEPAGGERSGRTPVSLEPAGAVVLALVLLAGFLWTGCWYRGQQHLARAMDLAAQGPAAREDALQAAEDASLWSPLDPEPHAVAGALLLAAGSETHDPGLIRHAGAAYGAATALDPRRAFFHERLSLVHHGLGEGLAALVEADKAFRCYPLQPRYRDRRAEMLRRVGGGS